MAVGKESLQRDAQSPVVDKLARAGWAARGTVYILLGWVALQLALKHHSGTQANQKGAFEELAPGSAILDGDRARDTVIEVFFNDAMLVQLAVAAEELELILDRACFGLFLRGHSEIKCHPLRLQHRGRGPSQIVPAGSL